MSTMSPGDLRAYLLQALESDKWNVLILRDSSDGVELELNRHHVWQLVRHLGGEVATARAN